MKPIGTYYPMDDEGRVMNRASLDKIIAPWDAVVEEMVTCYQDRLGKQLHSVWIRGSVPAGTAVVGVSDIDSFALVKGTGQLQVSGTDQPPEDTYRQTTSEEIGYWQTPAWANESSQRLSQKFPFVRGIEFIVCSWTVDLENKYPQLLPMIRTQAVKVFGSAIEFPGEQPYLADLKRNGRWVKADWEAFLEGNDDSETLKTFVKTFIRAAFEEVMEEEGKYATDFYPCIAAIAVHRPDWQERLVEMVDIFCEPKGKSRRLEEIAKEMVAEFLEKSAFGGSEDR